LDRLGNLGFPVGIRQTAGKVEAALEETTVATETNNKNKNDQNKSIVLQLSRTSGI
jgi:hypothetical protein